LDDDGKSIFFLAKRDEEADFNSLYRIALIGGEAELLFTHVNSMNRAYPSPDGSVLAFTATGAPPEKFKELEEKGFKAVVYEESVLPTKVWMLDLETLEAAVHDLPGSASNFTWSPDGERIAYIGSVNINDPSAGRLYVASSSGGERRELVNGWMTSYSRPGQVFAANGYAVVYPNYRGSTGRGIEFSKLDQHDYAEEEFNDLVDAKRHLVEEGLVDPDRVGITGGSYGGYASMWSASALTEEYAAAVAFVGISDQISKFGTGDIPYEMYNVHALAWPWDDWMWLLKRSPIYHAGKTKTPLLIMGGDKDPRVHPGQSLEMYRFVKIRTDTPVRLVIYPGEVHGNRNTAAQYDYSLRLMRWMDHYLKGEGGEPPPYELDHAERLEGE